MPTQRWRGLDSQHKKRAIFAPPNFAPASFSVCCVICGKRKAPSSGLLRGLCAMWLVVAVLVAIEDYRLTVKPSNFSDIVSNHLTRLPVIPVMNA